MLISVVATALILMAGTETAMKGYYKSAMHAFYDEKAGLEEGRGRLFWPNQTVANPVANCVFPATGAILLANRVCDFVSPASREGAGPHGVCRRTPYDAWDYQ